MPYFFFFLAALLCTACSSNRPPEILEAPVPIVCPSTPSPLPTDFAPVPARIRHAHELILLDAGHGGDDYGAKSHGKPTYHEKYLTLSTSKLVEEYLKQFGFKVAQTRTRDEAVSLKKRVARAKELRATSFVSIHFNAHDGHVADGIEVFYYDNAADLARTKSSKKLAEQVLSRVIHSTGAKSRGTKKGNYLVIRETHVPAILIEGGFMTNEKEMEKIKDPLYLKKIAWGIAQGIRDYLNKAG